MEDNLLGVYDPSVIILAEYTVAPENLDRVMALLAHMKAYAYHEEGCDTYQPHQKADDPYSIMLYEIYVDEASFNTHQASEHYEEMFVEQLLPLLLSRKVTRLRAFE